MIGRLRTEGDLRRFILKVVDGLPRATKGGSGPVEAAEGVSWPHGGTSTGKVYGRWSVPGETWEIEFVGSHSGVGDFTFAFPSLAGYDLGSGDVLVALNNSGLGWTVATIDVTDGVVTLNVGGPTPTRTVYPQKILVPVEVAS